MHPRRPQPSAQFSAPISRPQPSAQPSSLISSGFFSPPISSHSLAPTPSAPVHAILPTHLPSSSRHPFPATPLHPRRPQPSAQFSAAKLAHHHRLLLPTHFQPLPGTHAVRSRPRNSPHPFAVRSRPRSQARSSPAASSRHPFPATPLHPRRPQPPGQFFAPISHPQPSAQPSSLITSGFFSPPISSHSVAPTPSAAVRAILRTHFPSAAVRAAKLADLQQLLLPTHFQPLPGTHAVRTRPRNSPHPFAVRSRPRSQARSSPAASSPHPFPATPLHPRRPQPSAQSSSLISSGFFSRPISSHSVAPTPSAAVRAILPTHLPSAAVRAAKLAHHQRLLLPNHFQPPLHPRRPQPSAQPNSLISSGFFSHSFLSHPFPSFPSFPFLSLPFLSLPFPCTHAVHTPPFKPARSPTRLNN